MGIIILSNTDDLIENEENGINTFVGLFILVVIIILSIIGLYYFNFKEHPISNNPLDWGPFGDFFGGVLNPILGFFSFLALLYTIHIQQQELRLTRRELKRSVEAQKQTAEFTKAQSVVSSQQITEMNKREQKNDIFRLIESIDKKMKGFLNSKVKNILNSGECDLHKSISYIYNNEIEEDIKTRVIKRNGTELKVLKSELDELEKLLIEFDHLAGHSFLSDYYKEVNKELKEALLKVGELN